MEQEPLRTLGGFSEARPATAEIREITNKVRPLLEQKTNKKYEKFEAIQYKAQVVAGTNYLIKVDVGCDCYLHLRVFSGISKENDLELHGYQTNKAKNDELTSF